MTDTLSTCRKTCVTCGSIETAARMWIDRLGVPPGEDGHNITYSHCVFVSCSRCGAGQIEKLAHDCFDFEEVWDQFEWYKLARADVAALGALLDTCPAPLSATCSCALHRNLQSACAALPTRPWVSSLSAEEHVQTVALRIDGGIPRLLVIENAA